MTERSLSNLENVHLLEDGVKPNFGLVCITYDDTIRYRTMTRTHYLKFAEAERRKKLGELYCHNLRKLFQALEYCFAHDIHLYRMTANLFPLSDWEDGIGQQILSEMTPLMTGFAARAEALNVRVIVHPEQYVVLSSESESVRENSINLLAHQAFIFDALGLPRSTWAAINIHGGKSGRLNELVEVVRALPDTVKSRLTFENDEYAYSAPDILEVCERTGVPMVFDAHHHLIHEGLETLDHPSVAAFTSLARQTWQPREWQIVHLSNGRTKAQDQKHSDVIHTVPESYRTVSWIEVEAKAKEVAISDLKELWNRKDTTMSYVYGLFDNDADVRRAINALERLGRGDEVVQVLTGTQSTESGSVEGSQGTGAPLIATPLVPVAGVIPAATTSPGGVRTDATATRHFFEGLGEVGDYFSKALEKGAQMIIVDTSEADVVASLFKEANAQRVYDKRAGRDV
jgi:UV DNA damage endonuclease